LEVVHLDYFKAAYRILNYLKKAEQAEEFDHGNFNPGHFSLTARQWALTLERMLDDGHVKGVAVSHCGDGSAMVLVTLPRITTKGLEYLEENSLMRKAARLAKGIADITPRN